jgi:ER-bound oxygenase mpaB/B'/Rubber oxygenase, catalytic domain
MHLLTHQTRRARPTGTDAHGIYRNMVLYDFQSEIHSGFFLSYYRNFAIPSTAKVLAATGEMTSRPMKRSYDTTIVIHEIIANGFEHERSRAMIDLLRRVHKGVPGTAEDFVYVLMTLLVLPLRWIERYGWRRLTELEKQAATDFYAELGRRMGLKGIPATFADAGRFLDEYEDRNMGPSPEGAMLLDATVGAFASRVPARLRRFTPTIMALMMDKPQVAVALGLKPAPWVLRVPFAAVLHFRALNARRLPLPTVPAFVPGKMSVVAYPDGYTLDQIGPTGESANV